MSDCNCGQQLNDTGSTAYPAEQSRLGKYEKLETIGEGGFSRVYKAYDPELERWTALKVLNNGVLSPAKVKDQFFKEIKILAQLNIPNTIRLFDCGEDQGWLYYSMELINGVSLEDYCAKCNPDINKRLKILSFIALAVVRLHKAGIIHRDIKPRNMMIDEHGEIKLLDFGLGIQINRDVELQKTAALFSGSPGYMPPELFQVDSGQNISPAVDVYSLGVLAYEVLSGVLPYDLEFLSTDEIAEIVSSEPPRPMKMKGGDKISPRFEQIVMRCLSRNPSERPTSEEFLNAVRQTINGDNKFPWKVLLLILTVALILCCIGYYLIGSRTEHNTSLMPSIIQDAPPLTVSNPVDAPEPDKPASRVTAPAVPAQPDQSQQTITAEPAKTIPEPVLYKNSAPAELQDDWRNAKHELVSSIAMKNKGALIYALPLKHLLTIKHNGITLLEIDSAFQKKGCLYQPSGRVVILELRKNKWDNPEIFKWEPVAGNADTFRPAGN